MSTDRPNIILIMTDQQHLESVSAFGNPYTDTPAIDSLVKSGVSYKKSYCTYPLCGPARSSVFTGRPVSETGVYNNGLNIHSSLPTLGEYLARNSSYELLYAGKWHLREPHTACIPGFDVIAGGINNRSFGDYSVTNACEGYLRNRDKRTPFFLNVMYTQPHDICQWVKHNQFPMETLRYPEIVEALPPLPDNFSVDFREPDLHAESRSRKPSGRGGWTELHWRYYLWSYYRHVEMIDAEIGRVLQALEDTGETENTMVIFTSDHGEALASHGMTLKNDLYEEDAAVPLVFSKPDQIGFRTDRENLVSGLDIFPTVCDFAGVDIPEDLCGISLKQNLLEEKQIPRDYLVIEGANCRGKAVRSRRYKYITFKDDPVELLFDLEEDPGEKVNLTDDKTFSGILKEHRKYLREWHSDIDAAPCIPEKYKW